MRANNIEKGIFDYIDNSVFLSATAEVTTENIGKEEISSSYTVIPSFDTDIGIVDGDTGIQTELYSTIQKS